MNCGFHEVNPPHLYLDTFTGPPRITWQIRRATSPSDARGGTARCSRIISLNMGRGKSLVAVKKSRKGRGQDLPAPTLVSLFTGAGGLDIGLERGGFRTLFASDFDKDCVSTLKANQFRAIPIAGRSDTHLEGATIVQANIADLKRRADFSIAENEEIDLVAGGPPCQPFSSAGSQRGLEDPRGTLFEHFARVVRLLRPRMFLFENVRGLITARGPSGRPGEALELVRNSFEKAGYSTRCALLNSADLGSHQRRVRLFIIGSRISTLPTFPETTHAAGSDELPRWRTLGEFLKTMASPRNDEIVRPTDALAAQLAGLQPGSGLKSAGVKEVTRPGGHWGYRQGTFIADPTKPARTVTASSTQDWIKQPDGSFRRLTLRECAALQAFPTEWCFEGNRSSQFRQVGNAVPVTFGEVIGRVLAEVAASCSIEGSAGKRPPSASLPEQFLGYINYTARDEARNGTTRPRSQYRAEG